MSFTVLYYEDHALTLSSKHTRACACASCDGHGLRTARLLPIPSLDLAHLLRCRRKILPNTLRLRTIFVRMETARTGCMDECDRHRPSPSCLV